MGILRNSEDQIKDLNAKLVELEEEKQALFKQRDATEKGVEQEAIMDRIVEVSFEYKETRDALWALEDNMSENPETAPAQAESDDVSVTEPFSDGFTSDNTEMIQDEEEMQVPFYNSQEIDTVPDAGEASNNSMLQRFDEACKNASIAINQLFKNIATAITSKFSSAEPASTTDLTNEDDNSPKPQ